jgi:nucleoside-diphosphate-sugar epimerase
MARALVIGGTLFIGRALVPELLDRGDEVVIMHRGKGTPFDNAVSEIRADRTDVEAVRRALQGQQFDTVYDNVYDWQRGTSAEQVTAAALAASPTRRYVFTSSVAVYGEGLDRDEDEPLVPSDDPNRYGAQKADSERALFELHRTKGFPVSTLRPAFIYGPHNPFEREAFFWDRIDAGRPIIVPEDGTAPMHWVHVGDVARAAIRATEKDVANGHPYNLASPPITQLDFVRLLATVAGKTANVVHIPREVLVQQGGSLFNPPYYFGAYLDLRPLTVRTERVRKELGLQLTSLEEGLRETYQWYLQQDRPQPDYSWEDKILEEVAR